VLKKYTIVGIDPGTTVGLAFLDLKGRVIDVESGKNLSLSEIMYELRDHGEPVIVATDKAKAPEMVKRIASMTHARLYTPPEDLTQQEKAELIRRYNLKNQHEKDALAAAVKAYNVHSGKIRSLLKKLDFKRAWLGVKETKEEKEEREKVVVVEKRVISDKTSELMQELKAKDKMIENQSNIISQQKKRIQKLENLPKTADPLLKKELSDSKKELRNLKEKFAKLAKAVKEGKLEIEKKSKVKVVKKQSKVKGNVLTENPEVFEHYKKKGESCKLVEILYEDKEHVYYTVLDSCDQKKQDLLDQIVNNYKRKRERLFK